MLEKGKQSERIDYLDGLSEEFKDFVYETKVMNEMRKSERLSSRSNNSDESKNSINIKTSNKVTKTFEKFKIDQKDSEDILENKELKENKNASTKKDLNKSKKEMKNMKKKLNKLYSDELDDMNDYQYDDFNAEYLEGFYDSSSKNIELNPKYEEAQYYDDYLNNEDEAYGYDSDMEDEIQEESYNEIPRNNFFLKKVTNDNCKRDLI